MINILQNYQQQHKAIVFFLHIIYTLGCKCSADFGEEFGGASVCGSCRFHGSAQLIFSIVCNIRSAIIQLQAV